MTQERQKVLEMLESGKITVEQAEKLLTVLKANEQCKKPDFEKKMSDFSQKFEDEKTSLTKKFTNKIKRLNEKIFEFEEEKRQLSELLKNSQHGQSREDLEDEIENLDAEIEELNDEVEELEDSLEELLDSLDDLDGSEHQSEKTNLKIDLSEIAKVGDGIKKSLKDIDFVKLAEDVQRKAVEASEKAATVFGSAFHEFGNAFQNRDFEKGVFKGKGKDIDVSTDGLSVKEPSDSEIPYENCSLSVKYKNGAFNFSGTFELSESESFDKCLKPFVSKQAWDVLVTLLDEQFTGIYKRIDGTEILKIEVK